MILLFGLHITAIVDYFPFGIVIRRASRFGQFADPSAPPADLFNIWRDDYMLSPQQAAAEAAERAQNTLFDGVLPPFSNVGNTDRDQGIYFEFCF